MKGKQEHNEARQAHESGRARAVSYTNRSTAFLSSFSPSAVLLPESNCP